MAEEAGNVFKFFSSGDRLELNRAFSKRSLQPGEILCRRGEPANEMHIVVNGRLEVVPEDAAPVAAATPAKPGDPAAPLQPAQRVLMTLNSGQTSGEMSFFNKRDRSATVRAPALADVLVITRDQLEKFKNDRPAMALMLYEAILDQVIRRFRDLSDQKDLLSYWL